ncbi:K07496 putative transposase [Salmonella enterica]|nr:K07496 putative transposase [Salmonella enterica]
MRTVGSLKTLLPFTLQLLMVGLDAGVAKLATLSDGTVFEPVNSFQKCQKKLATLQRQLSRKVKFNNNWQKQKPSLCLTLKYFFLCLLTTKGLLKSISVAIKGHELP